MTTTTFPPLKFGYFEGQAIAPSQGESQALIYSPPPDPVEQTIRVPYANELTYLQVDRYDERETNPIGELLVNEKVAAEVFDILQTLFCEQYPIPEMRLLNYYRNARGFALEANNSFGFCPFPQGLAPDGCSSAHRHGYAVTINPATIGAKDRCVQLFLERGWRWRPDGCPCFVKPVAHLDVPPRSCGCELL
jgi:hypothetical protein